ncbi:DUF6350 family protein [Streptomyces sp. NPDC088116]|uniref:cell division protein PerM n=1 Tax=Streptomyces sp. NPDC088116 TaxID=3365825 RepID=UPI00381C064B
MTQLTDRATPLSSAAAEDRGRAAALTAAFLRGAIAAGLGLGTLAVLAMALWISSPYPESGAGQTLHVAAALWLLSHGIELVRPDTLSGNPAPLGLVPLSLSVLPVYLVYRAARDTLDPDEGRVQLTSLGTVATVAGGYLLVGAGAVLYTAGGPLIAHPVRAALALPLVPVLSAAAGAWTAYGRPRGPLPLWLPRTVRSLLVRTVWAPAALRRGAVAVRAGTGAALLLVGGGALLVGISLVWHAGAAHESFLRLAGDWSGRFAVLLLGLALVPNAAIWGASYGLGPGFALGTASTATPLAVTGTPALPSFPLLAALPHGPGTALNWAAAGVPVVAGLAVAWFTVRVAAPPFAVREEAWGAGATALTAALGGVATAGLMAFLAAMSGGPLGNADLAAFGPVWWLTGAAALVWTLVLGVPAALLLRVWRVRERRVKPVPEPEPQVLEGTVDGASGESSGGPSGGSSGGGDFVPRQASRWWAPWRRNKRKSREAPSSLDILNAVLDTPRDGTRPEGGADAPSEADAGAAPGTGASTAETAAGTAAENAVGTPAHTPVQAPARAPAHAPAEVLTEADAPAEASGPDREAYDYLPADAWHERGARQARWAAFKEASGDLITGFPAAPPPPEPLSPPRSPSPPRSQSSPQPPPEPLSFEKSGSDKGRGSDPGEGRSGEGPGVELQRGPGGPDDRPGVTP